MSVGPLKPLKAYKDTIRKARKRNLVLEGGGAKGAFYFGMLKELERRGKLKDIDNVAGSSAGALLALALCCERRAEKVDERFSDIDFKSFQDVGSPKAMAENNGLWKGEAILKLIKEYLNEQIGEVIIEGTKVKGEDLTFAHLRHLVLEERNQPKKDEGAAYKFKDLYVTGARQDAGTQGKLQIFSYLATPDIKLCDAVRASMSFPFAFMNHKIIVENPSGERETRIFSDGGGMRNYPMDIFETRLPDGEVNLDYFHDKGQFIKFFDERKKEYSMNPHTLGVKLDEPDEIEAMFGQGKTKSVTIPSIFGSLLNEREENENARNYWLYNSLPICNIGIGTLDFDQDRLMKLAMKTQGAESTKKYFDEYCDVTGDAEPAVITHTLPAKVTAILKIRDLFNNRQYAQVQAELAKLKKDYPQPEDTEFRKEVAKVILLSMCDQWTKGIKASIVKEYHDLVAGIGHEFPELEALISIDMKGQTTTDLAIRGGAVTAGCTTTGAAVGTVLIPVPVVGTLVGAASGFVVGSVASGVKAWLTKTPEPKSLVQALQVGNYDLAKRYMEEEGADYAGALAEMRSWNVTRKIDLENELLEKLLERTHSRKSRMAYCYELFQTKKDDLPYIKSSLDKLFSKVVIEKFNAEQKFPDLKQECAELLNQKDKKGNTLLGYSAALRIDALSEWLLEQGSDPTIQNVEGKSFASTFQPSWTDRGVGKHIQEMISKR